MKLTGQGISRQPSLRSPAGAAIVFSLTLIILLCSSLPAEAARISDVTDIDLREQMLRFMNLSDPYVARQWIGAALIGTSCGLLGTFIVVRRMALTGDMLSHAVLPGIVLGFLFHMKKEPTSLFIGALIAGLAGALLVTALRGTTRLKQDASLGIVLGGFYAIGTALLSMVQRMESGDKSGLSNILFGMAAAISDSDLILMGAVTLVSLAVVALTFKELQLTSFDPGFARSSGIPDRFFHYLLMTMLAFAVVISIQAVGVILVSALLIIPAATASMLSHRLSILLVLAIVFSVIASIGGAFVSFLSNALPTGPFMILWASLTFALVLLFSPQQGLIPRTIRRRLQAARIQRENTLKAIYHYLEDQDFLREEVPIHDLAEKRHRPVPETAREVERLVRHHLAERDGEKVLLTGKGWNRAREIVRNHRLWELYLTHAADIAPDHVHDDAERIEHVLGEDVVHMLEERFAEGVLDPHGRDIPRVSGPLRNEPETAS